MPQVTDFIDPQKEPSKTPPQSSLQETGRVLRTESRRPGRELGGSQTERAPFSNRSPMVQRLLYGASFVWYVVHRLQSRPRSNPPR